MEIITVTKENLEEEHICCAISNNKDCQVLAKKTWLLERFDDGLVFKKGDVRGKCFIEYIPAEKAWAPIEADGYMYIDCLWVSGQFKGQGYSNMLLGECIRDSKEKGKQGLVIYYAHQCPFTAKYVPLIEAIAREKCVSFKAVRFETTVQAQQAPAPFTTYSLFYNGDFVTNEILSDKKFEKMVGDKGL